LSDKYTMSLNSSSDQLQNKITGQFFDISGQFLPVKESVKKLLAKRSGMSKQDVTLMVDGQKDIPDEDKGTILATAFPLPDNNVLELEVLDIMRDVRNCVLKIVKEQVDFIQILVTTAIKIGSTIAAIVVLCAAPPFNVAAAITLAMEVIESIFSLCNKIELVLPCLDTIKKLDIILPDDAYNAIVRPIDIALSILQGILSPLQLICGFAVNIKDTLGEVASPEASRGYCRKIRFEIRRKRKQIRTLLTDNDIPDQQVREVLAEGRYEDTYQMGVARNLEVETLDELRGLVDELNEMEERCKTLDTGFDVNFSEDVYDRPDQTRGLFQALQDARKVADDIIFVYDVKLPDGTILFDLSEEELAGIRERYEIVFNNDQNFG